MKYTFPTENYNDKLTRLTVDLDKSQYRQVPAKLTRLSTDASKFFDKLREHNSRLDKDFVY